MNKERAEQRRFSSRERVALYLAADGKCADCSVPLEPGWHADHMAPYSRGGTTDVINGQALCPPCNLKKGDRPMVGLREWQTQALSKFEETTADFLCVATPGAGKTRFALAAAKYMLERGKVDWLIIVAPTRHLLTQWESVANAVFGIQIDSGFENGAGAAAGDYDGVAVTYQTVSSQPALYRRMVSQHRALVILDEVHHGGDKLSWGVALHEAFDDAERRLLLSGTPDRTDRNPVPFVTYTSAGKFAADYSYSYSDALADLQGVVRQIAFPAFDGDARWLDAKTVESKLKLSEADAATRSKALASALMPNGLWLESVLRAADQELTRQRETAPDAGGLVIAGNQANAKEYAAMLQRICGEPVTLTVSDVPNASDLIAGFRAGQSRWIVAVQMVSEGVDIPRLAVGVYATNTATELFFRQVVGRFVRARGIGDETCATLFIPSVDPLVSYAVEIEQMIPRALQEAEERIKKGRAESGEKSCRIDIDLVVPLAPSEGVHVGTIMAGDSFSDAELRKAEELAREYMPSSVTAVQMARVLRRAGMTGQTIGTTTVEIPAEAIQPSLKDQKGLIRNRLHSRVGYLARLTDISHGKINGELNRICGDKVSTAPLDSLKRRLVQIEHWIGQAE